MVVIVCSGKVLRLAQLTTKQESFCSKIAAGRSKSQAYREAYDTRGMSEQSIWREAHRLSVHPKVAPRLAEIQSQCRERLVSSAIADREEVLVAVTDILRSDESSDNAKLKSAEILGKYYALFDGSAYAGEPLLSSDYLLQELEEFLEAY